MVGFLETIANMYRFWLQAHFDSARRQVMKLFSSPPVSWSSLWKPFFMFNMLDLCLESVA